VPFDHNRQLDEKEDETAQGVAAGPKKTNENKARVYEATVAYEPTVPFEAAAAVTNNNVGDAHAAAAAGGGHDSGKGRSGGGHRRRLKRKMVSNGHGGICKKVDC